MSFCCSTSATSEGSVAAYEQLRGHVLAGSTASRQLDVLCLIREGIAAWIARCSSRAVAHAPPRDPARGVAAAPAVCDELHAGLARGLASMALANRRELRR